MPKKYNFFFIAVAVVFIIDQIIKAIFVGGFDLPGDCISLTLAYNKGVAFSMFASLGPYLKYIQIALIGSVLAYIFWDKELLKEHSIALGLLMGGGISNVLDRFLHEGVVDYIYWHCGFDFAIFNLADVMINLGVILILWKTFRKKESS